VFGDVAGDAGLAVQAASIIDATVSLIACWISNEILLVAGAGRTGRVLRAFAQIVEGRSHGRTDTMG
jgi:hypothetical protein